MHRFILITLLLIQTASAQPELAWVHTYDFGGHDYFYDVYALAEGGFAVCGLSNEPDAGFIVAIIEDNEAGDVRWMERMTLERGGPYRAYSLIETDSGDLVVAGTAGNQCVVFRLDDEGEIVWQRDYDC